MLFVAAMIKMQDGGAVFYKQKRGGLYGRAFDMLKFRSMKMHKGVDLRHTSTRDTRITPLGMLIRKTSIDELPQLINVLKGDMSIVGPRPHMIEHDIMYSERIANYTERFSVKPGLTGLAQVKGHRGCIDTIKDMQLRVRNDVKYAKHWSLLRDIKIILSTIPAVLSLRNAV